MKGLAEIKNNQIQNQSKCLLKEVTKSIESIVNALCKYEEKSLHYYVDGSQNKLILGDNTNDLYKSLKDVVRMIVYKDYGKCIGGQNEKSIQQSLLLGERRDSGCDRFSRSHSLA